MKIPAAWSQSDSDTGSQSRSAESSQIESWVSDHSGDLEERSKKEDVKSQCEIDFEHEETKRQQKKLTSTN